MATESAKTARAEEEPRVRERSRVSVSAFPGQAVDAAFVVDDERTEEALRRSEASFRALIELLPDGVVVHRGGRILYVNPEGVSRLGYDSSTELVGRPVADIIHPDDRAEVASRLALIAATGEPLAMREDRLLKRDGSTCQAEVVALQVMFDGAPAIVALSRDVTEQRRLQAQLAQAGRLSQVFLNLVVNAAHSIDEGAPQSNTVKITTKRRGNEVCVAVADTGHGIPHEHLGRLFNPFFTTKAMGLGLSICASIVRAHGGRI